MLKIAKSQPQWIVWYEAFFRAVCSIVGCVFYGNTVVPALGDPRRERPPTVQKSKIIENRTHTKTA